MASSLRELVLNEARAYAMFANGRTVDHRFAVSLVCDDILDSRFNRTYIIEPAHLTRETLEEVSRDFFTVRLPLRLDVFLPIPAETIELLERKGFEMTEEYASVMMLQENECLLRKNPEVEIRELTTEHLDDFSTIMLKAYGAPLDMVHMFTSIFRGSVARALQSRGTTFFLAFVKGEPVGTLYLFSYGGVGGIYNLAVDERYRRHGVATTLVLQAIEDSRAAGNKTVCLTTRVGSVQEKFFERLKFTTVARRKRAIKQL
ncbi:MAG: hypothetical protein Kow0099_11610 [Candidatus Abyssubacteria bacterium]